jgi:hypothetical protein
MTDETSGITLSINSKSANGTIQVTKIRNEDKVGMLKDQIRELVAPDGYVMTSVNIFSTKDRRLSLNMFGFQKMATLLHDIDTRMVTADEVAHVYTCIEEIKRGQHETNPRVPK